MPDPSDAAASMQRRPTSDGTVIPPTPSESVQSLFLGSCFGLFYLTFAAWSRYPKDTLGDFKYIAASITIAAVACAGSYVVFRRRRTQDESFQKRIMACLIILLVTNLFPSTWFATIVPQSEFSWYVRTLGLAGAASLLLPANFRLSEKLSGRMFLGLLILALATYGLYAVIRHHTFWFLRDLSFFDQIAWRYSQFRSPVATLGSTRNLLIAEHFHPTLAMLAPLYRIHRGAGNLILAEMVAVIVGVIPIYRLSNRLVGNGLFSLVVSFAYLYFTGIQWGLDSTFHPETVGVSFLSWAAYYLYERKWWRYAICTALAVGCKETYSIYFATLGLAAALTRGRRMAGAMTVLCSAAVYLLYVEFRSLWTDVPYAYAFGGPLGKSAREVLRNLAAQPDLPLRIVASNQPMHHTSLTYFLSFGFISLVSPFSLLALPMLLERVFQTRWETWVMDTHYGTSIAVPLAYSTLFAARFVAGRFREPSRRHAVLHRISWHILVCSLLVNFCNIGKRYEPLRDHVSPLSRIVRSDFYYRGSPEISTAHEMLSLVPPDAVIVAQDTFASHLSSRDAIYEPADPTFDVNQAEYVVLETFRGLWPLSPEQYKDFVHSLLANPNFGLRFAMRKNVLFQRGITSDPVDVSKVEQFLNDIR